MNKRLKIIGDEIESVLVFIKRTAFSLFETTMYLLGLYTLLRNVFHF